MSTQDNQRPPLVVVINVGEEIARSKRRRRLRRFGIGVLATIITIGLLKGVAWSTGTQLGAWYGADLVEWVIKVIEKLVSYLHSIG